MQFTGFPPTQKERIAIMNRSLKAYLIAGIAGLAALVALLGLLFGGVIRTPKNIPPGNVGIVVDKYGSNAGVEKNVVYPGTIWPTFNQHVYLYPTFRQTKNFVKSSDEDSKTDESFLFKSADGIQFRADVGVSYNLDPRYVPHLFQLYRGGLDEINQRVFRNILRKDLIYYGGKDSATALIGSGVSALFDSIQASLTRQVAGLGVIQVEVFVLGDLAPTDSKYAESISSKAIEAQKAAASQAKIQTARMDSSSKVIAAAGEAESNRRIASSITPELIDYIKANAWNGANPQVVSGAGGGVIVQLPTSAVAASSGKHHK